MKNKQQEKIEEIVLNVERELISIEDAVSEIGDIVIKHKFNSVTVAVGFQAVKELILTQKKKQDVPIVTVITSIKRIYGDGSNESH